MRFIGTLESYKALLYDQGVACILILETDRDFPCNIDAVIRQAKVAGAVTTAGTGGCLFWVVFDNSHHSISSEIASILPLTEEYFRICLRALNSVADSGSESRESKRRASDRVPALTDQQLERLALMSAIGEVAESDLGDSIDDDDDT